TRVKGSESTSVTIFRTPHDRGKLLEACKAFGCELWIAVYVETDLSACLYLTSLENYDLKYRVADSDRQESWKMGNRLAEKYKNDPDIRRVSVTFESSTWAWPAHNTQE